MTHRDPIGDQAAAAHTAWLLSRCARSECNNEGTEKLGDTYLCRSCFEAEFQRVYDKEREMGR